jgi:hypothetical protein
MSGIFDEVESSIEGMREDIVKFSQTVDDILENNIEEMEPLLHSIMSETSEGAGSLNIFSDEGRENVRKLAIRDMRFKKLLQNKKAGHGTLR